VHFVADEPPEGAVARIAGVFRETGGDLRAVSATLIDFPEAWSGSPRKIRSPQDWLVAAMRATGARGSSPLLVQALRQLRHPLWAPPSPKGFGDTTREWVDPDSLLNRAELARTMTQFGARQGIDPPALLEGIDVEADDPLHTMLGDRSIPIPERLALAIAGPAFQWR
jgi:uncharacterized protein (DUF1800 family)